MGETQGRGGQSWGWNLSADFGSSACPLVPTRPTLPTVSPIPGGETEAQRGVVTYQDRVSGSTCCSGLGPPSESLEGRTSLRSGVRPGALGPCLGAEVFPHSPEGPSAGIGVSVYAEATLRGQARWGGLPFQLRRPGTC